jgi:hypothetical protein
MREGRRAKLNRTLPRGAHVETIKNTFTLGERRPQKPAMAQSIAMNYEGAASDVI